MNKNEFLNQLRKRLSVLSQDEIEELISEYSEHIDHKMSEGKSEEEAVNDFGDLGELSRSILQAYKLNDHYTNKPKFSEILEKSELTGRKFLKSFEEFYSKISLSEVFKFLILIILSFGLVALLKFPFMLFKSISLWFLEIIFGYNFVSHFDGIWTFVVNAVYYLCSILLMISVVHFGQQRYMHITHRSQNLTKKPEVKTEEESIVEEGTEKEIVKEEKSIKAEKPKQKGGFKSFLSSLVNLFYNIILWSLRLLILAILFPVLISLIIGLFMWGMLVFLVLSKVPLVGLMFTTGMGLVFGLCILFIIFAFTFGLKLKTWKYSRIFSILLITLILGGFGTIWSLNELSQFEWVSNDNDTIEQEYQLSDIERISMINTWPDFMIDNSLEDGVIICVLPKTNDQLSVTKDNKNLLISNNDYSDLNEINQIRQGIMDQFNALKERKLILSYNDYSNRVVIRVNEKDYDSLISRVE
jgi:uncharacterized membrane protein